MWHNKLRTFLSLLGITIGIFCIVILLTAVSSLQYQLKGSLNKLGNNFIIVEKWPWAFNDPNYAWWKYFNRPLPTYYELQYLKSNVPNCKNAAIMSSVGNETVTHNNNVIENISVSAVSLEYAQMNDFNFYSGRFFSNTECDNGSNIAVIGYEAAMALNNDNPNLVGKNVKVLNNSVRIVGVLNFEPKGIFENSLNNSLIINYNYFKQIKDEENKNLNTNIKVDGLEGCSNEQLKEEIRIAMRSVRKLKPKQEDNFALNQMSVLQDGFSKIFSMLNLVGAVIGLLSIVVGGFGIANIMFVSVRERTNQIGLKKAIGAQPIFILLEFLTESVILCTIGGLLGILLVFIITQISTHLLHFTLVLNANNILIGLSISIFIGIISGFIPALNASKLDPVAAIRFK